MKNIPSIIAFIVFVALGFLLLNTDTRGCQEVYDDTRYKIQKIQPPHQGP